MQAHEGLAPSEGLLELAPSEGLLEVAPSEGLQLVEELVAWVLTDGAFVKVAPSEVAQVAPSEDAHLSAAEVLLDQE